MEVVTKQRKVNSAKYSAVMLCEEEAISISKVYCHE